MAWERDEWELKVVADTFRWLFPFSKHLNPSSTDVIISCLKLYGVTPETNQKKITKLYCKSGLYAIG